MIFQQFNLVGRLGALTHVLIGRLNHTPTVRAVLQLWSDEDKAFTFSALEPFDIASLAAQRADNLSGRQQQRVAIACARPGSGDHRGRRADRLARSAQRAS